MEIMETNVKLVQTLKNGIPSAWVKRHMIRRLPIRLPPFITW
ncbi:hypothetical protein [Robertmurraya massiliosenegalensis]|nr:hypothetical protein [Robertmurraya massiliosenegalensis]